MHALSFDTSSTAVHRSPTQILHHLRKRRDMRGTAKEVDENGRLRSKLIST